MAKVKRKNRTSRFRKIFIVLSLLFILLTIPLAVIYVKDTTPKDSRSQAAEIAVSSLNTQIESNFSGGRTAENTFLLTQRKEQMETLAVTNPTLFLQNVYSSSQRNRFPENQRALIEEQAEISGDLMVVIKDNFEDQISEKELLIKNENGFYSLKTTAEIPEEQAIPGKKVSVNGYRLNNIVVANSSSVNLTGEAVQPLASGIGNFLVVPINFKDDRSRPYTRDEIRSNLFGERNSGKKYYQDVTENRYIFGGSIIPWQESEIRSESVCDNVNPMANYAYTKFDLSKYHGVIFVFPKMKDCDWIGAAGMADGIHFVFLSHFNLGTIAHEWGHVLGLQHSDLSKCMSAGCKSKEYGDLSDVMGFKFANFNGPHIISLGIMKASGVKLFTGNGDYTLNKVNGKNVPQVLRIDEAGTARDIYVEFRGSNSLYSSRVPYSINEGALIYRWDGQWHSRTTLIDISSGDGNPDNLVLRDGRSVSIGPVQIKQLSHDNNSVKLRVERR